MADLLQDFESYFKSKNVNIPIFRDTMPDNPDNAIALYEYQGTRDFLQIDGATRPVQIVVRDKSATAAKVLARQLYSLLKTDDSILYLTSERWTTIYLKEPPFKLKADDKDRIYYCFNVITTTYED